MAQAQRADPKRNTCRSDNAVYAARRRVGALRVHRDLRASACFLPFGVQTTRCAAHVVTCTRDGIAKATRTPEETR
ncbi:hypothetical protein BURMUCF2_B0425 [Burkholderia multivorans CF2]|nr:hypothetical protein BURMUCF2_B0425 [Burkholderia multivorans CF2]